MPAEKDGRSYPQGNAGVYTIGGGPRADRTEPCFTALA